MGHTVDGGRLPWVRGAMLDYAIDGECSLCVSKMYVPEIPSYTAIRVIQFNVRNSILVIYLDS